MSRIQTIPLKERIEYTVQLESLPDDATVDTEMAAVYLNCQEKTVYGYVTRKVLKPLKWGVRREFDDEEEHQDKRTPNFTMGELRRFKTREKGQPKATHIKMPKRNNNQEIDYKALHKEIKRFKNDKKVKV